MRTSSAQREHGGSIPGVMTLFAGADDPRSQWVRIVAAEKGLPLRLVGADRHHPPEDLIDLNPYQSIPTLVDRELVVYDPQVICEYLDERFPHPAMLPGEPAARAQARLALLRIAHDWYGPLADIEAAGTGAGERRDAQRARKMLLESILAAEPLFKLKPFFLSDQFSVLDAAVAPVLWRLRSWDVELPADALTLQRYAARMYVRPSFRLSLSTPERGVRA